MMYTEGSSVSANCLRVIREILTKAAAVALAEEGHSSQHPHLTGALPLPRLGHGGHRRNDRRIISGNMCLSLELGLWVCSVTITIMPPQRGL